MWNSHRVTTTDPLDVAPLAVAVLSLLAERDMHPYEMIQTLRARREDQWVKLRPASLYHKVDGLVARGLAEVAVGVAHETHCGEREQRAQRNRGIQCPVGRRDVEYTLIEQARRRPEVAALLAREACSLARQLDNGPRWDVVEMPVAAAQR